jgi:choline transport protein
MQFSILNGGPASLVYGGILTGAGAVLVALSLAEMASIDPVVGAQYRWSAKLAPKWPRFWGLIQGWLTILAWITATAASPAYLSFGVQSLISLWWPAYPYPAWHTTLLMIAFTFPPVIANLWFRKIINPMEAVGAVCHGVFFVATVILLGVSGPRVPDERVWNNLTVGTSGWTLPGVTFGIGLLPAAFSTAGMDGILHMSESEWLSIMFLILIWSRQGSKELKA